MPTMGDKLSKEEIGRIGCEAWLNTRFDKAYGVYNSNYGVDSPLKWADFPRPWTAMGPDGEQRFATHAEALAWAFKKAEAGE